MDKDKFKKLNKEQLDSMNKICNIAYQWGEHQISTPNALSHIRYIFDNTLEKFDAPNNYDKVKCSIDEAKKAYEGFDSLQSIRLLRSAKKMIEGIIVIVQEEITTSHGELYKSLNDDIYDAEEESYEEEDAGADEEEYIVNNGGIKNSTFNNTATLDELLEKTTHSINKIQSSAMQDDDKCFNILKVVRELEEHILSLKFKKKIVIKKIKSSYPILNAIINYKYFLAQLRKSWLT